MIRRRLASFRYSRRRSPGSAARIAGAALALLLLALAAGASGAPVDAGDASGLQAAVPGTLIVAAGADSAAGFRWVTGAGGGRRLLGWPEGSLLLPADMDPTVGTDGHLAVPYGSALRGFSGSRGLAFRPGRYQIEAPLLLDDSRVQLFAAAGELVVEHGRVTYMRPARKAGRSSDLLFLAALILVTFLLLVRARRRTSHR
ncbi:MAG: hypothetical protein R6X25_04930 [Candidatus Krumholzibacteriia bacterium]